MRSVRLLASVTSEAEARLAVECGADIIDCKNPREGALGALPRASVAEIVGSVGARVPVSATIGDLPADPDTVAAAAAAMAATGVDYVKVGFFSEGDAEATIGRLGQPGSRRLGACRLVGVLIADRKLDWALIPRMAAAGFAGVMLDTADKSGGALPEIVPAGRLRDFIEAARDCGLLAGLAGALGLAHIPALLRLDPDILGFRGALCAGARRTAGLDAEAMRMVRSAVLGGRRERPAVEAPAA